MERFEFPDISRNPSTLRTSEVEDLGDGTKAVYFVVRGVRDESTRVILGNESVCQNCAEVRVYGEDIHCAPLVHNGILKGSYELVNLGNIDRNQAVCPLYTQENPTIVVMANELLDRRGPTDGVLNILDKFPNGTPSRSGEFEEMFGQK